MGMMALEYHHFKTPNKMDLDQQSSKHGLSTPVDLQNPFFPRICKVKTVYNNTMMSPAFPLLIFL